MGDRYCGGLLLRCENRLKCAPLEQCVDILESLFLVQSVSGLDLGYQIILVLEGRKLLF
jgi:hypothetical protein